MAAARTGGAASHPGNPESLQCVRHTILGLESACNQAFYEGDKSREGVLLYNAKIRMAVSKAVCEPREKVRQRPNLPVLWQIRNTKIIMSHSSIVPLHA